MHELTVAINCHAEPHSFSHYIQEGGIVDFRGVFRNVLSILRNKVLK